VDDETRAELVSAAVWAVLAALALYVVTRPPVRRLIAERLPTHAEVSDVLRDAERITKEASAGGPTIITKGE
jgi:hypothetical protein